MLLPSNHLCFVSHTLLTIQEIFGVYQALDLLQLRQALGAPDKLLIGVALLHSFLMRIGEWTGNRDVGSKGSKTTGADVIILGPSDHRIRGGWGRVELLKKGQEPLSWLFVTNLKLHRRGTLNGIDGCHLVLGLTRSSSREMRTSCFVQQGIYIIILLQKEVDGDPGTCTVRVLRPHHPIGYVSCATYRKYILTIGADTAKVNEWELTIRSRRVRGHDQC